MWLTTTTTKNSYVLAVATAAWAVNVWHGTKTVQFRKASGITYPNTYATPEQADKSPAAYQLNCGMFSSFFLSLSPPFSPTRAEGPLSTTIFFWQD